MSALETAVAMYQREHDRWNQWALFFFGSIASVFVAWSQISQAVSLLVPALLSFVLSILWVLVALNIRATTRAWFDTILVLECGRPSNSPPFSMFLVRYEEFNRWKDFLETLAFWQLEPFKRVTRILTLTGVLSVLLFGYLTARCLYEGPQFGRSSPNVCMHPLAH